MVSNYVFLFWLEKIRVANCKFLSSRGGGTNGQQMTAIAFRDYNTANNQSTNVLRFVASATGFFWTSKLVISVMACLREKKLRSEVAHVPYPFHSG